MLLGGVESLDSIDAFVSALQECRDEKLLDSAHVSYLHVCRWGLDTHHSLGNFLVPLFVDCGSLTDARRVFGKLPFRNEHSWTSLMQGFNGIDQWQNAMDLYQEMMDEDVCPGKFTFMALLKACTRLRLIKNGQDFHAEVTMKGIENDLSVGNTLLDMYSKCGLLLDSQAVFDGLHTRDIFSWGALATGFFYHGFPEESLECFNLMQEDGIRPNSIMYVRGLKACGSLKAIDAGHQLHADISMHGYENVPSVASALVGMYAKCGSLLQAQDVFSEMSSRDVMLWNSLLAGYAEHGNAEKALECWEEMKAEGVVLSDAATFVATLKACIQTGAIEGGQMFHAECCLRGLEADPYIGSSLVEMYTKLGFLVEARHVFDGMPLHDVVLWTSLITGYAEYGCHEEALDCLQDMQHEGVSPNSVTFIGTLKACDSVESRHKGQEIHIEIVRRGFERDTAVVGSLAEAYVRWGSLVEAQSLFDGPQDVVTWNILISGYVEHELYEEGIKYFKLMQVEQISPSISTYISTLKACCCLGDIQIGYTLHSSIIKQGMEGDAVIRNMLVDLYVKCYSLAEAEDVLNRFPTHDAVAWTALIQGYANLGLGAKALQCFERMKSKGVYPDAVTFVCGLQSCSSLGNIDMGQQIHTEMAKHGIDIDRLAGNSLVDMYAKLGLLAEACCVFEQVLIHDVVSWNTLIHGFVEQGLIDDAVNCFEQMQQEGFCPDEFSWSTLIHGCVEQEETEEAFRAYAKMKEQASAPNSSILANLLNLCGSRAALQIGKRLHSQIHGAESLEEAEEVSLATSLIDMYSRCGSMEDSWQVFDSMKKKDLVAWNALSTGYARHGKSRLVFSLCSRMQEEGLEPNEITWLSLLSVCRHSGLVDKGRSLFERMRKEAGIAPNMKHYSCTIDLLGRAGRLDEIVPLMEEMPFEPNLATWHTVMSACQKYGDVQLGRKAFACARSLGNQHAGTYVFMSNIFADSMIEHELY